MSTENEHLTFTLETRERKLELLEQELKIQQVFILAMQAERVMNLCVDSMRHVSQVMIP
jgi:hypothetical protein